MRRNELTFLDLKRYSAFLIFSAILLLSGCKQEVKKAVILNDQLVNYHEDIMNSFDQFTSALAKQDRSQIYESRQQLILTSQEKLSKLKELPVVKDDGDFRNAAHESYEFYKELAEDDLRHLSRWYLADSITVEQNDSIDMVLAQIQDREQQLDEAFKTQQKAFAENHGFGLK